ncbi:MAG: DNA polymerase III subunit beta [Thermaceae bacterium]
MEIKLTKRALAEALTLLERVIPAKSSNPLFTYLSLATQPGEGLVLTGTGGEVDLRVFLPISPPEPEEVHILVPALPFVQVVRSLPGAKEEEVALEVRDGLNLRAGPFQTRFTWAEAEGYPEPTFPEPRVALKAQDLLQALTHVRYAASTEEYRAIFRGIQLEFAQGLRAVASDGYRLAIYELKPAQPFSLEHPVKLVVPARSMDEVVRVLKYADPDDEVSIGFSGGTLALALSPSDRPWKVRMALRLMEGEFPNYEGVIPKEFVTSMEVEAEILKESLKRVGILADKKNHRVDLLLEENRLLLSAEGDYGKGEEELPVQTSGSAITVSFNARYFLEALAPLEGTVRIALSGVHTPAVISEGPLGLGGGYLAVIVPLRV